MQPHLRLTKASKLLGVTSQTLRRWANQGRIKTIRTKGNHRRIPLSEIERMLKTSDKNPKV